MARFDGPQGVGNDSTKVDKKVTLEEVIAARKAAETARKNYENVKISAAIKEALLNKDYNKADSLNQVRQERLNRTDAIAELNQKQAEADKKAQEDKIKNNPPLVE